MCAHHAVKKRNSHVMKEESLFISEWKPMILKGVMMTREEREREQIENNALIRQSRKDEMALERTTHIKKEGHEGKKIILMICYCIFFSSNSISKRHQQEGSTAE